MKGETKAAAVGIALVVLASCGDDASGTSGGTTSATSTSGTGATGGAGGAGGQASPAPVVRLPKESLGPEELAVLVNDQDPDSLELGAYYASARGIPAANVITLSFPATGSDNLPAAEFDALKATIDAMTPAGVQAYAVAWTYPTRVDCMSLTSAIAFGFDTAYCNTSGMGCGVTKSSDYFDSDSAAPFTDHGMRPAMVLAGETLDSAKALVDRGLAADATFPPGDGVFIRTTDVARSVRWESFVQTIDLFDHEGGLTLEYIDNAMGTGADHVENRTDLLFYFTGLTSVPALETNTYRPGAVADHLTSFGGSIPPIGQMSVLAWLEAGVTASYGTLQEPCNYTYKFPDTEVLLPRYFRGATVIEAYWKSVHWPGEGLFVGEPLAKPWGTQEVSFEDGTLTIRTTALEPGRTYELRAAEVEAGPYATVQGGITTADYALVTITLEGATAGFYELVGL